MCSCTRGTSFFPILLIAGTIILKPNLYFVSYTYDSNNNSQLVFTFISLNIIDKSASLLSARDFLFCLKGRVKISAKNVSIINHNGIVDNNPLKISSPLAAFKEV